jgi:hypothetical protein
VYSFGFLLSGAYGFAGGAIAMNMKDHILTALSEQFTQWDELLASLSEEQITTPDFDESWSIKDIVNHLWGWQQISIARMNSGLLDREPEFPSWLTSFPGNWEESAHHTNAWIYQNFHNQSWAQVYKKWREGFLQLLNLSEKIPESYLLDGDRYAWLKGKSLAFFLVASYDHHQEHLEKLITWLQERRRGHSYAK